MPTFPFQSLLTERQKVVIVHDHIFDQQNSWNSIEGEYIVSYIRHENLIISVCVYTHHKVFIKVVQKAYGIQILVANTQPLYF